MQFRSLLLSILTMNSMAHNNPEVPGVFIVGVINETPHPVRFYHLDTEIAEQQAQEIDEQEANGIFTPLEQRIPGIRSATPELNSPLAIPDAFSESTNTLVLETPDGLRKFSIFRKGIEIVLSSGSFAERELLLAPQEGIRTDRIVKGHLILRQHFLDTHTNPTERARFCPLYAEDMLEIESN